LCVLGGVVWCVVNVRPVQHRRFCLVVRCTMKVKKLTRCMHSTYRSYAD
jgi:hypothetical protein